MTWTNIKNLPENGKYFTERGYSQNYPWVQVRRTEKTIVLAEVEVGPDPEWKPEMLPGGFAAHCVNQSDQTWLYKGINHQRTVRICKNKKGQWVRKGVRFDEDYASYFYDYNF